MKVNVNVVLTTVEGTPMQTGSKGLCSSCKRPLDSDPLTLRLVVVNALLSQPESQRISGEEKLGRFRLANRIYKENEPHLTAEETVLIKTAIADIYAPLVSGQAWEMIEALDKAK